VRLLLANGGGGNVWTNHCHSDRLHGIGNIHRTNLSNRTSKLQQIPSPLLSCLSYGDLRALDAYSVVFFAVLGYGVHKAHRKL